MSVRKPSAYFVLNQHRGPSPERVYEMLREVQRRMGLSGMGPIGWSPVSEQGRYVVAFGRDAAADRFERLYRTESGQLLIRRREAPEGLMVAHRAELATAAAFLRSICGHPSHSSHLN